MLEGKLKIELTNVKTGKKTVHEQHNLVTDNVQFLLNAVDPRSVMPLYDKGMGGLLLFDSEITDAVGNHLIGRPKNSKLIGYADRDVDISTAYKGSRNAAECRITDDSYTTVWDFSTAQLNGTIGAIALAPLKEKANTSDPHYTYSEDPIAQNLFESRGTRTAETIKYYYDGYNYDVPASPCQPIYYDPVTNYMYFVQTKLHSGSYTTLDFVLIGRLRYTMNYGVTQSAYDTERPEILFTTVSNDGYPTIPYQYVCEDAFGVSQTTHTLDILFGINHACWYGDKQGYVYAIQVDEITGGSRIMWAKFKVFDGSFDCVEAKYAEFEGKYFVGSPKSYYDGSSRLQGSFAALIDDDKFIVLKKLSATSASGAYILTKSPSGIAITDELNFTINYRYYSITVMPMGVATIGEFTVYSNGKMSDTVGAPIGAYSYNDRWATFYPYNCPFAMIDGSSVGIPNLLLSTVCNLAQPVQKTSAQTMKITYTITSYRPMYISTQPHDTSGTAGQEKTLTVAVMDGVPAYTYQWQKSSDGTTWTNCSEATANTANLVLELSSSTGNKYYHCIITDSLSNTLTSLSAYVTLET